MTPRFFRAARVAAAVAVIGALSSCSSRGARPSPAAQETATASSAVNVDAAAVREPTGLAPRLADASAETTLAPVEPAATAPAAKQASAAGDIAAAARSAGEQPSPRPRCGRGERFGCRSESHGAMRARTPFDPVDPQVCGCIPHCTAPAPTLLVRGTGRRYPDGRAEGTFRCSATGYPSALTPAPTPLD